jgi:hypothetical protein
LFVYPSGTVDVHIGPTSAHFDSNEWLRVDYLTSYFSQRSIITWHNSKFYTPETIMKDVLTQLYEIFTPFVDRSVHLVYKDVNGEWREKGKGYVLERLKQK